MTASARPMIVLDSPAVVALLVDGGQLGEWVAESVADAIITGPALLPFEVTNVLRRQQLAGEIDAAIATLAHADLVELPLKLWPYSLLAERAWPLRDRLTAYGASYVALADLIGASMVTLDQRLARAHGLPCKVILPPAAILAESWN